MLIAKAVVLSGVLLLAAPLYFCQAPQPGDPLLVDGQVKWFDMAETESDVARLMGPAQSVAEFGAGMVSLGYQLGGDLDEQEFSHQMVFEKASHRMISVVRNYEPEISVEALFPPSESVACYLREGGRDVFGVRARRLSGGRLLLAMGAPKAGQTTSQLLLIRESDVGTIYPWIAAQLKVKDATGGDKQAR